MEKKKDTAENAPVMPKDAKYDVFISYSRRDYLDENRRPREDSPVWLLWKYLDGHGVRCWIDLEGVYAGSQFAGLIADAIDESKMMIFVSSERSNSSDWTIGEVLTAHDEGKPIIPFRIDDTPYSKKFSIMLRPLDYIDLSPDSEESFGSVLKSVETVMKLYDEKLAEQKEEIRRKEQEEKKSEIREHIAQAVRDYSAQAVKLRNLFDDIAKNHLVLGDKKTICPVCGKPVSIGSRFCKHCGWTFVPPFVIAGEKDKLPSGDPELMALMQSIWQKNQSAEDNVKKVNRLEEERDALSSQLVAVKDDLKALDDEKKELNEKLKLLEDNNSTLKESERSLTGKLHVLEATEKSLRKRISELEKVQEAGRNPSMDASSTHNGHEYVDLGFPSGTLWATCNVGASKPSEYGDYFAWGETKPKDSYNLDNYAFDGRELNKSDDAASINWGGEWRMPTRVEWEELNDNCDSKWAKENGVAGHRFTSKNNGNSIFFPTAGLRIGGGSDVGGNCGYYWSSSLHVSNSDGASACYFKSGDVNLLLWYYRYYGLSVRPVLSSSSLR